MEITRWFKGIPKVKGSRKEIKENLDEIMKKFNFFVIQIET